MRCLSALPGPKTLESRRMCWSCLHIPCLGYERQCRFKVTENKLPENTKSNLTNSSLPSLQSPKSAIFTKPSLSSSRLSSLRSLKIKRILKKQSRLLGMNDKTIQRLTDIQFYGREETVNPRPHRRSRTCWVTRVWWGGGGGRGQGEGGGGQRNSTHIRKPC